MTTDLPGTGLTATGAPASGGRVASGGTAATVRRRFLDVVTFLVCALVAVSLTQSRIQSDPSLPARIGEITAAAVSCLALCWRRRWPVPTAVVAGVLAGISPSAQLPALVGLATVAVRSSPRWLAAVAVVQSAATVIRYASRFSTLRFTLELHSSTGTADAGGVLTSLLLMIVVIVFGLYVRARRQLLESLRQRAERAEAEQHLRISQARIHERTRIAREMHDVLAHRISLISLQAGALQVSRQRSDAEVTESAAGIRSSAHQALDDLREVIGVLRTQDGEGDPRRPQPTLGDIAGLVEESARTGMTVSLDTTVGDLAHRIPDQVGRTAYRVVQEGLTNARKHSPGAVVRVTVGATAGSDLQVEVHSTRTAAAPPPVEATGIPGSGHGLLGLGERVRLLGGRVTHGPAADGGFRLSAVLPIGQAR